MVSAAGEILKHYAALRGKRKRVTAAQLFEWCSVQPSLWSLSTGHFATILRM
jgi:hypothetical protein